MYFYRVLICIFTCLLSFVAIKAISLDNIPGAHIGYIITSIPSGKIITSKNADNAFVPASILKCFTTAAALSHLGPEYSFITNFYYTGNLTRDTIHGNLLIIPSGDPSLGPNVCNHIAKHNISHIAGSVIAASCEPYVNPLAMIEDIGTDYGVGWSTFNYRENKSLINDSYIEMPKLCISDDFILDLTANGISVGCNIIESTDTTLLFSYQSQPLDSLCRYMMHNSNNLYAEAIGRSITPDLSLTASIDSLKSFCNDLDIDKNSLNIVDMSGLSRINLVTPSTITALLQRMSLNKTFIKCFPMVGREGTAKRLLRDTRLAGKIALKSGSMNGILAYAGYKLDDSGKPTHTIVVIINNALCKQSVLKQCIEQWLLKNF